MIRWCWMILIALCLCACGKKGALVRPEALVPARVPDFKVMQRGDLLQLSWSIPKKLESGGKLTGLAGFRLYVRDITTAGEGCRECPDSWELLRRLDLEFLEGVARDGDRLIYIDNGAKEDASYLYRLISFTKSADESPPSITRFTKRKALPPPVVKVTSSHASVTVECVAGPLPDGFVPGGCVIYRSKSGEPQPLNPYAVITDTGRYEDTLLEPRVVYAYTVAVAATIDGQAVEGIPVSVTATLLEPD